MALFLKELHRPVGSESWDGFEPTWKELALRLCRSNFGTYVLQSSSLEHPATQYLPSLKNVIIQRKCAYQEC